MGRIGQFLVFVVLLAGEVGLGAGESTAVVAQSRPNVLLICVDDLKPLLGCYGDSLAKTPNLDRLAAGGVRFERAYCNQAVCAPSRNALLTGLRPQTLGIYDLGTNFRVGRPEAITLGQHFRAQGYYAESLGKIFHVGHGNGDDARSWDVESWKAKVSQYAVAEHGSTGTETKGVAYESADVPDNQYADGQTADEAIVRLRAARERGTPFFLAVGFLKPHLPFVAPQKYWDLYQRDELPVLDGRRPEGAVEAAFHESTEVLGPVAQQKVPSAAQAAEMRHGYFANISYLDAQVGKVLGALESSGLADRTIVVFLSDHGYQVGEHGLWGKTSNFEYDARVPLLIRSPVQQSGPGETSSLVELIDVFPTLAELCGLPQPAGLEGVSLVPVLRDGGMRVKAAARTQHPRPAYYDRTPAGEPQLMGYSVRTESARYTEWRDWKTGVVQGRELYLESDEPGELRNVVGDAAAADVLRECERLLRQD